MLRNGNENKLSKFPILPYLPIIQMTREGTFFWYFKTIFLTAEFKVVIRSPKFNVSALSFLSFLFFFPEKTKLHPFGNCEAFFSTSRWSFKTQVFVG